MNHYDTTLTHTIHTQVPVLRPGHDCYKNLPVSQYTIAETLMKE
jgi:hypothetical protein